VIVGALSSVLLKYTKNVRVIEPLLVFVTAYLSYLLAELVDWSGIIAIIFCGLMQAQYTFHNISHKSYTTVKYFSKTLASISEAMIFLLLGMELITNYRHAWNVQFIAIAIFVCVVVRFIGEYM
jgi:NhaP-type Na+/H+ or K+/H+ antiporter